MQIRIKGVYAKKYRAADGTERKYFYDRVTKTRLPDEPESEEFLRRLHEVRRNRNMPQIAERTLGDLMRKFKDSARYAKLRATTRSEYDRHMEYLEPLGDTSVSKFDAIHGDALEKEYIEQGKPALGAAMRRTLSLLLGFAVKPHRWIKYNPLTGVGHGDRRRRSEVGQAPYEEFEIRRFRDTNLLGTRARLVFELADLPSVEREAVLSGRVSIITEKSRTHVVVPVSKAAEEAYAAFEATCRTYQGDAYKPSKYAICTLAGAKIGKRRISGEMRDAYEAAGFKESQRTHALRYTAATRLFELGFHYSQIAEIVGHAQADMARKYTAKVRTVPLLKQKLDAIDAQNEHTEQSSQPPGAPVRSTFVDFRSRRADASCRDQRE